MKKFTENKNIKKHYANNDILKNDLYDLIEETLKPNIDNVVVVGKEDLIVDLVKIVENQIIDNNIDIIKNFKYEKSIEKDSLLEAFNKVYEKAKTDEERAMTHFNIDKKAWDEMSKEEKETLIEKLPERKGKKQK